MLFLTEIKCLVQLVTLSLYVNMGVKRSVGTSATVNIFKDCYMAKHFNIVTSDFPSVFFWDLFCKLKCEGHSGFNDFSSFFMKISSDIPLNLHE